MTDSLNNFLSLLKNEAERRREFGDDEYCADAAMLDGFVEQVEGKADDTQGLYDTEDLRDAYREGVAAAKQMTRKL